MGIFILIIISGTLNWRDDKEEDGEGMGTNDCEDMSKLVMDV